MYTKEQYEYAAQLCNGTLSADFLPAAHACRVMAEGVDAQQRIRELEVKYKDAKKDLIKFYQEFFVWAGACWDTLDDWENVLAKHLGITAEQANNDYAPKDVMCRTIQERSKVRNAERIRELESEHPLLVAEVRRMDEMWEEFSYDRPAEVRAIVEGKK